jgi:AcrR family transcriptional regulator
MREIAQAAECSTGLAYRYFSRKEDIVLAHYTQLSLASVDQINNLPPATIADLYAQVMRAKIEQITPYRDSLGALFSSAMNPNSDVAVLGMNTAILRERMISALTDMIAKATDKPRAVPPEQLATLLYSGQLLIILFWLYDRTPNAKATQQLLDLAHDGLLMARPALMLPPVVKAVARLAVIVEPVFGGKV